jgi:alpha-galactosidase
MRNPVTFLLIFALIPTAARAADPSIKVFILAGQSNMEGKAKVQLLDYQARQPATKDLFVHFRKDDHWIARDDVWIKFLDRKGNLTVGYGSPNCIGPELEFGFVMGDHYDQPVLLIKTAWGGRSLYRDFRPPSAGLPDQPALDKLLADLRKHKPDATLDDVKSSFGATYRDMLKEIRSTLANLQTEFPQYHGEGYELAGLVWFQGWNDMIDDRATAQYAANMAHFIRDVRKDLESPNLPIVIGQMGVDGDHPDAHVQKFKTAQAATLDSDPAFKDNVALVKTDAFWDTQAEAVFKKGWRQNLAEWNTVGSDYPYHYLGSPKTMLHIGHAFADAMLDLQTHRPAH